MALPDSTTVRAQVAAFEADLALAESSHDAQKVRDKYLGRKNSVVASWMQMISTAPAEQKREIGRMANELKQAIEQRWFAYQESAARAGEAVDGARGGVDITLPGRAPRLGH